MGPASHARDVCSRSDQYRTTRGRAAPRSGRIDCKILSSSAQEAANISRLINVLVSRMNYMDGGYGSWIRRDLPQSSKVEPRWSVPAGTLLQVGVNLQI